MAEGKTDFDQERQEIVDAFRAYVAARSSSSQQEESLAADRAGSGREVRASFEEVHKEVDHLLTRIRDLEDDADGLMAEAELRVERMRPALRWVEGEQEDIPDDELRAAFETATAAIDEMKHAVGDLRRVREAEKRQQRLVLTAAVAGVVLCLLGGFLGLRTVHSWFQRLLGGPETSAIASPTPTPYSGGMPTALTRTPIRTLVPTHSPIPLPTATPIKTPMPVPPTLTDTAIPSVVLPGWGQGRIAFVSNRDGNYEIYAMKADGTGETRLTDNPADDWSPAWSPDGRSIAFTSTRDAQAPGVHNIYVMNADGSNLVRLTYNQAWDEYPAWSPDGQCIAFVSTADNNAEIFAVNRDGSDYRRLTYNQADDINPTWALDGRRLAFASRRTGTWQIFVMDADGSNQTRITHSEGNDLHPVWSPDGGRIAFFSDRDGNKEIYVMNADGTEQTRLTQNPAIDEHPSWSPDGSAIAFWSDREGTTNNIYVMWADGSHLTRLTWAPADDGAPSWGK